MDGFAAAGLSQLTSLNLKGESGFLFLYGGLGCCILGTADGDVAEAVRYDDGWLAEMLGGGSDSCHSLCCAVWVSGNDIGDEGVRHLVDGFVAGGLSQLTS